MTSELLAPGRIIACDLGRRFELASGQARSLKAILTRREASTHLDFWAVRHVSFDVQPGETFGIVGHNGSGKSTLLKMIARIFGPSEGECKVGGRVSSLLELGAGFHPEFSAVENIYLAGAVYGIPRNELDAGVNDIIEFAELERFAHQPIKTFSSGMFMRLGFSVAMHVRPDVLLLDEALAVGDAAFVQKCYRRIETFRDHGGTLLLVTHDGAIVRRLCDRAILLEHGELVAQGDARDVMDSYLERSRPAAVSREASDRSKIVARPLAEPGQAVVAEATIVDSSGTPRDSFHENEPFTLQLTLRPLTRVNGCVIRTAVKDESGFEFGVRFLRDLDLDTNVDRRISLTDIVSPWRDGHFLLETAVLDGDTGAVISGIPVVCEVAIDSRDANYWGPIRVDGTWVDNVVSGEPNRTGAPTE